MHLVQINAPIPDLRIVATGNLYAHEEHDSQRSSPLIENIRSAEFLMNPPIVTTLDDHYMILDGANRCFAFQQLEYPHILVQVVTYDSGYVLLDVWHHVVSRWNAEALVDAVGQLEGVELKSGWDDTAIAHLVLRNGYSLAVQATVNNLHDRNRILRHLVGIYQRQAVLDRTTISEPHEVLPLYPEAIALVVFPRYSPADILAAARQQAYLPPGISRHIIQGRAIRVNFPVEVLRDATETLEHKNEALQDWIQRKFASRQVRYYAEATYQYDE